MPPWNFPDVLPPVPGEYHAALDPEDVAPGIRRWWNGHAWSNPYSTTSPEHAKAAIRQQISPFFPFWQLPAPDTATV